MRLSLRRTLGLSVLVWGVSVLLFAVAVCVSRHVFAGETDAA